MNYYTMKIRCVPQKQLPNHPHKNTRIYCKIQLNWRLSFPETAEQTILIWLKLG